MLHSYVITDVSVSYWLNDEEYSRIVRWCNEECKSEWIYYSGTFDDFGHFAFNNIYDAMAFKLRWV